MNTKIPARYGKLIITIAMSAGMSGVMSFVMGVMRQGLQPTLHQLPKSWAVAFLIALPTSFILAPVAYKISNYLTTKEV